MSPAMICDPLGGTFKRAQRVCGWIAANTLDTSVDASEIATHKLSFRSLEGATHRASPLSTVAEFPLLLCAPVGQSRAGDWLRSVAKVPVPGAHRQGHQVIPDLT